MLGTGTQLDPYQITTVAEFRSMNDSTAYFKLMNDLDVNDSEWASGWGGVTLQFKEFDGNGYEIRNIVTSQENSITIYDGGNTETTEHTKNLKLFNCVVNHNFFIRRSGSYSYYLANFTNCQISITGINVPNLLYRVRLKESALTLSGMNCTAANLSTVEGLHLERCHVMLDLDNTGTTDRIFDSVSQTSIRGKLKTVTSGITSYVMSNTWYNSYFACEVPNDGVPLALAGTATGVNFIDRELINRNTDVGGGYNLTTAQCKDKDYLNSIGFVVV